MLIATRDISYIAIQTSDMYHCGMHYGQLPTLHVNNPEADIIYCKQQQVLEKNDVFAERARSNLGIFSVDLFPCSLCKNTIIFEFKQYHSHSLCIIWTTIIQETITLCTNYYIPIQNIPARGQQSTPISSTHISSLVAGASHQVLLYCMRSRRVRKGPTCWSHLQFIEK